MADHHPTSNTAERPPGHRSDLAPSGSGGTPLAADAPIIRVNGVPFPLELRTFRRSFVLGSGGLGAVVLYRGDAVGSTVAVKGLRPEVLERYGPNALLHEADKQATPNHPNIACVYEYVSAEVDGASTTYLIMQYVEGRTLRETLQRGPLSVRQAIRMMMVFAEAVEAAHRRKIVHCDLKPENVVVTVRLLPVLLDWGLAIRIDASRPAPLRGHTPGYGAPEQVDRTRSIDRSVDIWAVGCILYECLTGVPAFRDDDGVRAGRYDRTALPDQTPRAIRTLIDDCLSAAPEDRPSVAAVYEVLDRCALLGTTAETLLHVPNNVPQVDPLIGWADDARDLADAVLERSLVVLYGLPGSGRTRLCIEAARQIVRGEAGPAAVPLSGGVWWVDLAGVTDAPGFDRAVADAVIGADLVADVDRDELHAKVHSHLPAAPRVVVLDHLASEPWARDAVRDLLSARNAGGGRSDLHVLVTSDRRLGIPREFARAMPELPHPGPDADVDEIRTSPAVRLFIEVAGLDRTCSDEDAVVIARICRALAGHPLLITIAAGLAAAVPLTRIETELDGLVDPRDELPRIIRRALAEMAPAERTLLERLTVFHDGWSCDAMVAICADEPGGSTIGGQPILRLVTDLVARNCLVRFDRTTHRYSMIETIRTAVRGDIAPPDPTLIARHRACMLDMVEHDDRCLTRFAQPADGAGDRLDAVGRLDRLERERANVVAAIRSALDESALDDAARLLVAFDVCWELRGDRERGVALYEELLRRRTDRDLLQVRACVGSGLLSDRLGRLADARADYQLAQSIAESITPTPAEAAERTRAIATVATNLGRIAQLEYERDGTPERLVEARACHERAIEGYHSINSPERAKAMLNLAVVAKLQGRLDEARRLGAACLRCFEAGATVARHERCESPYWEMVTQRNLAEIEVLADRPDVAIPHARAALRIATDLRYWDAASKCLDLLGLTAAHRAEPEIATRRFGAASHLRHGRPSTTCPPIRDRVIEAIRRLRAEVDGKQFQTWWTAAHAVSKYRVIRRADPDATTG